MASPPQAERVGSLCVNAVVRTTDLVRLGAWSAVVAALGEAAAFLVLQRIGLLAGPRLTMPVSMQITWASLLVDVVLFAAITACLLLMKALLRIEAARLVTPATALFVFTTLFDWGSIPGYLHPLTVALLAAGFTTALVRAVSPSVAIDVVRRTFWPAVGVAALAAIATLALPRTLEARAAASLPAAAPGAPNVLFVVIDTLRADHVSAYGYSRPTTPAIDRLAAGGALFTNTFGTSSWTLPSHASLVTGRYTFEHHAGDTSQENLAPRKLDARYPTIAEALLRRGYRTGAFSANVYYFIRWFGFGRGFLHFEDTFMTLGDAFRRTMAGRLFDRYVGPHVGITGGLGRRSAGAITDAVLDWVERDRSKPFFAFLNYFDVHDPYVPVAPFQGKFGTPPHFHPKMNEDLDQFPKLTPGELQDEIAAYDESLAYVDSQIGRLLDRLRDKGLLENTLVVVTSDHGESFGERGLYLHRNSLYREQLQVPLVLSMPGRVPAGQKTEEPVSLAELPSTVLAIAGLSDTATFPLAPLTRYWPSGPAEGKRGEVVAELAQFPYKHPERPSTHGVIRSIASGQWQLVVHQTFGCELFDLSKDEHTTTSEIRRPDLEPIARDLDARLASTVAGIRQTWKPGPGCVTGPSSGGESK